MGKGVYHIYQRSDDWGVIFYDDRDRLVYYTQCAVQARRKGITVLAASLMYTHTHQSARGRSDKQLSLYVKDSSSAFGRAYNHTWKRNGPVFHENYGRSLKLSQKEIRSNLAYVNNNHVEKKMCKSAIDCRWCFLAYAVSKNPFSLPLDKNTASKKLLRVMRLVKRRSDADQPLTYEHIDLMFRDLGDIEREQLIDHIIYTYSLVSYSEAIKYYGSFDTMLLAFNSNTGSEYEIAEAFVKAPDTNYSKMIRLGVDEGWLSRIYTMSDEEKTRLARQIRLFTDSRDYQIAGFLHSDKAGSFFKKRRK